MAIIPLPGRLYPSNELAFTGPRGDYWENWKVPLSTKGLSRDNQKRYIQIGVTTSMPTKGTSRSFFEWLSNQPAEVLERHIPCVLRHDGPAAPRVFLENGTVATDENGELIRTMPAKEN